MVSFKLAPLFLVQKPIKSITNEETIEKLLYQGKSEGATRDDAFFFLHTNWLSLHVLRLILDQYCQDFDKRIDFHKSSIVLSLNVSLEVHGALDLWWVFLA